MEMSFKDLFIKNEKLALSDVKFETPEVVIFTTSEKSKEKKVKKFVAMT